MLHCLTCSCSWSKKWKRHSLGCIPDKNCFRYFMDYSCLPKNISARTISLSFNWELCWVVVLSEPYRVILKSESNCAIMCLSLGTSICNPCYCKVIWTVSIYLIVTLQFSMCERSHTYFCYLIFFDIVRLLAFSEMTGCWLCPNVLYPVHVGQSLNNFCTRRQLCILSYYHATSSVINGPLQYILKHRKHIDIDGRCAFCEEQRTLGQILPMIQQVTLVPINQQSQNSYIIITK